MQNSFKEAYDNAVKQADEMMNSFNIIMNAGIKQKLGQLLSGVREQLTVAERVAARTIVKVEYEAEMARRLEALTQALSLINVAAKKNAINSRLVTLKSSVDNLNEALTLAVRQPQRQNHPQNQYQNRNSRGNLGRTAMPVKKS